MPLTCRLRLLACLPEPKQLQRPAPAYQHCLCMAPKKGRGKGGGAAASPAGNAAGGALAGLASDLSAGFAVELHAGEKDNANLAFIEYIVAAWELIHDNHVFAGIQTELPLAIAGSQYDCGTQHPFEFASFKINAISNTGTYTAGMNMFRTNLQWSPTPGVPLRVSAIERMTKTMFKEPVAINEVHIAVTSPYVNASCTKELCCGGRRNK